MHKRNAKFVASLAMVTAAVLAVSVGLASASGTTPGGVVHIYEADTALAGNYGTVILTGAITDYGTDCQGAACGNPDGINVLELSKGSFEINVNDLGNKLASSRVDPVTCSADGTATAPIPIIPGTGTGAYTGIHGTFYTTGSTAEILPTQNGACDTNAAQFHGVLIAKGSGPVSFK